MQKKFPRTARELVEYLADVYKPRCKDINETDPQHFYYAGQVSLVNMLVAWMNEDKEEQSTFFED